MIDDVILIFKDVFKNRYTHEKGGYTLQGLMSVFHYFKVRKIVTHKIKVILRDNDPLFTTIGYILQFEAVFNF